MRELTNKSASIACELAALLMVVEECDVDQVERENLISPPDEYRINLRQAWWSRMKRERSMDNFYTYRSKRFAVTGARGCCAHVMCCLPFNYQGEAERIHVMSLTHCSAPSDELANSLDISTFQTLKRRRQDHDQQCEV